MFKIPHTVPPTDEQMKVISERWWSTLSGVSFMSWTDKLKQNSFAFEICKTEMGFLNELLLLEDTKGKNIDLVRQQFANAIEPALKKMNCEDSFFIKLISRSPKDYLSDETNHGKPTPLTSTKEAMTAVLSSMRCFEDLCLLQHLDIPPFVVRPYIEFEAYEEFRCIIKDKKIVGIIQYYYFSEFPELTKDVIIRYNKEIRKFINNIVIPEMTVDSFIADVIVANNGRPICLLETNPYGLSDPCLFHDYDSFDNTFMWIVKEQPQKYYQ